MTVPMMRDLVAAAPTNPKIISNVESGAANNSYTVFVNLEKKFQKKH